MSALRRRDGRDVLLAIAAMTLVVLASNVLVQVPIQALGSPTT